MVPQFPGDMVPLLRCNNDAGELAIAKELRGDDHGVLDAVLRCKGCEPNFAPRMESRACCRISLVRKTNRR